MAAMIYRLVFLAAVVGLGATASIHKRSEERLPLNERPIVGILSLEVHHFDFGQHQDHMSHIPASYVKYMEGAGARVVPILINQTEYYYRDLIRSVNAIFIPGAPTTVPDQKKCNKARTNILTRGIEEESGYAIAGTLLLRLAKELNDQGTYLPVWGTCLGFEFLTFVSQGATEDFRAECSANNMMAPLDFKPNFRESRMFSRAPATVIDILQQENVTPHFHDFCVTEKNMTEQGLMGFWRVIGTNRDTKGLEFASAIEARRYPFYGTIFHPEKIGYEWVLKEDTPHDLNAISIMQYFADFFVQEARKNNNKFITPEAENKALIYNYHSVYTGNMMNYEQVYFFD